LNKEQKDDPPEAGRNEDAMKNRSWYQKKIAMLY
jgi:hypothetical protein